MPRNRTAFAALAALSLALYGSAVVMPAAAIAEDTDFVCYDMPNPNPDEGLVCMTLSDFKAECAEGSGLEECDLIEGGETVVIGGLMGTHAPVRAVPQSLSGSSDSAYASGRPGGGFIILAR